MGKKRTRRAAPPGGSIEMTPMIDVVFQLMIYFILTSKPVTVSAHLDVFRPSASRPTEEVREPPKMIQIEILPGALVMNGRSLTLDSLSEILTKLGAISKTQTVMIMCGADSEHEQLIEVLDRCTKAQLSNLSVVSMD
jgi:biopolymer transport protein ExbD